MLPGLERVMTLKSDVKFVQTGEAEPRASTMNAAGLSASGYRSILVELARRS
jgi:hypothetical protein